MVCDPNSNSLNPPNLGPPPNVPGFGFPIISIDLPFPDINLPDGIPEDLLSLLDFLKLQIPGGILLPNFDEFSKSVLDAVSSLLNQLAPYLALYNFFQALLNMILCIIDVICALMNPFKLIGALRRLFKRCLPIFLNLFPWLALIAMIIALLLLLLALIQYLIDTIRKIIEDIIDNINLLARAIQINAPERDIIAAARKIAQLLCLIEQLFAILIAFQAILAIIDSLSKISGRSVCGKKGTTVGLDAECCDDEVCPPFIAQNPDGITGTQGRLIYQKEIDNDVTGLPSGIVLPVIREERWQFIDEDDSKEFKFSDIITEINGNSFWPEGLSYESNSNLKKVPYTLDITLNVDPAIIFGHSDAGGARDFIVKDVRVIKKPTLTLATFDNSTNSAEGVNGVLRLEGGVVYESDGVTPFLISGQPATLNTFVHFDAGIGLPTSDDGYDFISVEYLWNINHAALLEQNIITLGCVPDVEIETTVANLSILNFSAVTNIIPSLPNIGNLPTSPTSNDGYGVLDCLATSLNNLRQNVSVTQASAFQAEVEACLNGLRQQTLSAYTGAISQGTSIYTSTIELDPDVQFINSPIIVTVRLKDPSGTIISFNVPADVRDEIAEQITGELTFGTLSAFTFDGIDAFTAQITSDKVGTGEIKILFDGNILSLINNRDNDNVNTVIEENVKTYEFVGSLATLVAGEPAVRRDEIDIANDGD